MMGMRARGMMVMRGLSSFLTCAEGLGFWHLVKKHVVVVATHPGASAMVSVEAHGP